MQDHLIAYAIAHKGYVIGLVAGFAFAHIPQAVRLSFHVLMQSAVIRSIILANPEKSKAVVDEVSKELKADIDAESGNSPPKQ